jgi:hypothetical protein
MNFLRRNWYYIGGVIFVVLAVVLAVYWTDMSVLRRLMVMSFMALVFHQFEEYAWPGGFPAIYNIVFRPMGNRPARYPLNPQNVLITNVFVAYTHYVLPIVFPNIIWLGFAPLLFGMSQIILHGVMVNKKMQSIYNPGLISIVFMWWPIGIYYIWYVVTNGLAPWWDWPVAVVYMLATLIFGISMPVTHWISGEDYPIAFTEEEMARFHVREKMARIRSAAGVPAAG